MAIGGTWALVLPAPGAHAFVPPTNNLGPTTGPVYLCVSKLAFPPFPNIRMVQDADDCLPFEFLQVINTSLQIGKVCDTQSVAAGGNFNIDVSCPPDDVVVSGGYSCSYNSGADLLAQFSPLPKFSKCRLEARGFGPHELRRTIFLK